MSWKNYFSVNQVLLDYYSPEHFAQCQWQKSGNVSNWYLGYRILFAVYIVTTWALCIFNLGRDDAYSDKFFIYLTSWAYSTLVIQSLLGILIVVQWKLKYSFQKKEMRSLNWYYKLYWILHTTGLSVAGGITGSFWATVYNPEKHPLDFINITSHLMNTVVMTIDFILVKHPFRILHVYWPFSYTTVYFIFTYFYYLAGGTDREENHAIYPTLNWETPLLTLFICFLGLSFLVLVHIFYWILQVIKNKIWMRYNYKRVPVENGNKTEFL